MSIINLLKRLGCLVFPSRCSVCNKVIYLGRETCDGCIHEIRVVPDEIALMLISNPNINMRTGFKPSYDGVAAPYYYEDGSEAIIKNLKFKGRRELGLPISLQMYNTYCKYIADKYIDCICFVPSKFKSTFVRGYDHVKLLARLISKHSGVEFKPLLKLVGKKEPQHTLSAAERLKNLRGKFALDPKCKYDLKDKNVLLIDDIMTTGATISECSRVLKRNGAKQVYGLIATINL